VSFVQWRFFYNIFFFFFLEVKYCSSILQDQFLPIPYTNNLMKIVFYIGHNISNLLLIVDNKYKLKKNNN